jgi:hypothetical protein
MGLLWTVLEPELAIINANLPLMRRCFAKIIPKMLSVSRTRSKVARGKDNNDFEKLSENGIVLRTVGGGYMQRNSVIVGAEGFKGIEGGSMAGIMQERSVRVDFDNISEDKVGLSGSDGPALFSKA